MKIIHPRRILRGMSIPLYNKLCAFEYMFYRRNAISSIRQKDRITVIFLVLEAGMWKSDSLYEAMLEDKRFNPILCAVPHNTANHTKEYIENSLEDIKRLFQNKNYKYVNCYEGGNNSLLDLSKLEPDIIIYLDPYDHKIEPKYHYSKYQHYLTCYIDYSFCITNEAFNYNEPIQITAWRNYIATCYHKKLSAKYAHTTHNIKIVGYPIYDSFKKALSKQKNHTKDKKKVVVWAPHQSIFPLRGDEHAAVRWSTFLLYSELMLRLAKQYINEIYFIFRPHPMLRYNLYKHCDWGKEKTDIYYNEWCTMPNSELSDSDYVKQFCFSDALIHDGGGFLVEYLYTNKPCLYLSNYVDDYIKNGKFNEIGVAAWNAHYHARSEEEICKFIEDVLVRGKDTKKEIRNDVLKKYALPPNNKSVAENIIDDLISSIYEE